MVRDNEKSKNSHKLWFHLYSSPPLRVRLVFHKSNINQKYSICWSTTLMKIIEFRWSLQWPQVYKLYLWGILTASTNTFGNRTQEVSEVSENNNSATKWEKSHNGVRWLLGVWRTSQIFCSPANFMRPSD